MKRSGLFFLAAATLAVGVAVAGGCTTFGASDDPDAGDAGEDAETGPATCTPSGTASNPMTCTKCAPDVHFGTMGFDAAIIAGSTAYALNADNFLYTASTEGTVVFASSMEVVRGVPQSLVADDTWLYVSTSQRVVRAQLTNLKVQQQLVDTTAVEVNPFRTVLGKTFVYLVVPQTDGTTNIMTRPKAPGGSASTTPLSLSAFAVEGDAAYYAPRRAAGATPPPTYLTKLADSSTHGPALPADPIGLAIRSPYAYVAYRSGSKTQIARFSIDGDPANAQLVPLVLEEGVIDNFALDGDRMYWSASRGFGNEVVATADICGGDARDIALGVTPFGQLSFDGDYVYGGGDASGAPGVSHPVARFSKNAK